MLFVGVQRSDGKKPISPGVGVQGAQLSPSFSKHLGRVELQEIFPLEDSIFTSVAISASLWIQAPMQRQTDVYPSLVKSTRGQ